MSIITRCPQCGTQFRASPQQLRASEGWVRCGQCDQVFDAGSHAVSQRAIPPPDPDVPAPLRVESPAPDEEALESNTPVSGPATIFSRPAASPAPTSSAWSQRLWSGAVVLLALMLLAQWVGYEKDLIAARAPALKPILSSLCEAAACGLKPPHMPEFLQIESSAYDPLGEGIYRLSMTLRNTANWPIAFPAIELTVTDASERPLVTRILLPIDLGARVDQMDARSAHELKVYLLSTLPIEPGLSGYRLTAFYP